MFYRGVAGCGRLDARGACPHSARPADARRAAAACGEGGAGQAGTREDGAGQAGTREGGAGKEISACTEGGTCESGTCESSACEGGTCEGGAGEAAPGLRSPIQSGLPDEFPETYVTWFVPCGVPFASWRMIEAC